MIDVKVPEKSSKCYLHMSPAASHLPGAAPSALRIKCKPLTWPRDCAWSGPRLPPKLVLCLFTLVSGCIGCFCFLCLDPCRAGCCLLLRSQPQIIF